MIRGDHDSERSDKIVEKLIFLHEQISETEKMIDDLKTQEKKITEANQAKTSEIQELEYELRTLKSIGEMDHERSKRAETCITEFSERVDSRSRRLAMMKSQWSEFTDSFGGRRRLLELELYSDEPDHLEKLCRLKQIEQVTAAILSELQEREDEHSRLILELEKQPKVPLRRSYLERIAEITKNSRKQDADVEKVTRDIREVQIETNSISDRFYRVFSVLNEAILREVKGDLGKKDPAVKNIYQLLGNIHNTFQEVSEKILLTDRVKRETAEFQSKLAALVLRGNGINKLESELAAIIRENEILEQQINGAGLDKHDGVLKK